MENPYEPVTVRVENGTPSQSESHQNEADHAPKSEATTLPELPQENYSDEDTDFNIYGNEGPLELPIKVQDLANHVQDMKSRPNAFRGEFMVRIFQINDRISLNVAVVNHCMTIYRIIEYFFAWISEKVI